MAIPALPTIAPTSESWVIENASRSGGPGITGTEQTVGGPTGRWRAKLTFQLLRDETPPMRALLMGLRGQAGSFLVGPFDLNGVPRPPDDATGWAFDLGLISKQMYGPPFITGPSASVLAAPAELMDTSVIIRMPLLWRPYIGSWVGIGQRLHVVTAVTPQTDTDSFCSIQPPLRADVAAGTAVTFTEAVCPMKLAAPIDALPISAQTLTTDITLDLVELPPS